VFGFYIGVCRYSTLEGIFFLALMPFKFGVRLDKLKKPCVIAIFVVVDD
jgi:hypothetical protein